MVLNDVNIAATAVNVVMFFMGTLTFALILGVITEDLNKRCVVSGGGGGGVLRWRHIGGRFR